MLFQRIHRCLLRYITVQQLLNEDRNIIRSTEITLNRRIVPGLIKVNRNSQFFLF